MNKSEFWTPMPLPSIAADDSLFRNIFTNNWSGQPEGLTYQRAINALENYGHYAELTLLGKRLIDNIKVSLRFTQQFDPFTGNQPDTLSDFYGPTMLSVLDYISHLHGVHFSKDKILWSSIGTKGKESFDYEQILGDDHLRLITSDGKMTGYINKKKIFSCTTGVRVITDKNGQLIEVIGIDEEPHSIVLKWKLKQYNAIILPNCCYRLSKINVLERYKVVDFTHPWPTN